MVVAFARASSIKVEIYWLKKGLHHLYHFKVRTCFFRSFTHSSHAKQLTFHHVPRKQRPKSNKNISNHCTAIFHVLELYSSNQIPFCQIRLRSNACRSFPCKQPAFNHVFLPHCSTPLKKASHGTKSYWLWYLSYTILPRFDFFYVLNCVLATLDLIQSRANSL